MKVKELKDLLNNFHDDTTVLMSKDPEGNRYWHVEGAFHFPVWEKDGDELYRADVPDDVSSNDVVMIWPTF